MLAHRLRLLALGGALAVSALSAASCSSDDAGDSGGIPTVGTSETSDSTAPTGSAGDDAGLEAPTDRNAASVLYDQCMAEQGFPTDAASEAADGGGQVAVNSASAGSGPSAVAVGPGGVEIAPEDMEAFHAANEVCRPHLANVEGDVELSAEQQAAMEDAVLKMQQCMEAKGFDIQLSAGGENDGGMVTNIDEADGEEAAAGPPADPEALEAATEECQAVFDDYPELADVPHPGNR